MDNLPSSKTLAFIDRTLNAWLKPEQTAEKFDLSSVGLLIEPRTGAKSTKVISTIFLCNDLTMAVLAEAIENNADLIISYHAPIYGRFEPNAQNDKRSRPYGNGLRNLDIGLEIARRCYDNAICLYVLHTAWDSVPGGLNDSFVWNLAGLDTPYEAVNPSNEQREPLKGIRIECQIVEDSRNIFHNFSQISGTFVAFETPLLNSDKLMDDFSMPIGLRIYYPSTSENEVKNTLKEFGVPSSTISPYIAGSGRIVRFETPVSFSTLVEQTKRILGLKLVQVAFCGKEEVSSIAFAGGSGGYFIKDAPVDVIITGEVCHSNVIECLGNSKSLIICGHTESERPFLQNVAKILRLIINCPSIVVSKEDKSPIQFS